MANLQLYGIPEASAVCYCGRSASWEHRDVTSDNLSSALCDRHVLLWLRQLGDDTTLTVWPVELDVVDEDDDSDWDDVAEDSAASPACPMA